MVFSQHPKWVYYASKCTKNAVYCLYKTIIANKSNFLCTYWCNNPYVFDKSEGEWYPSCFIIRLFHNVLLITLCDNQKTEYASLCKSWFCQQITTSHLIPIKVCLWVNILELKIWESKTASKSHLLFFFMDMIKIWAHWFSMSFTKVIKEKGGKQMSIAGADWFVIFNQVGIQVTLDCERLKGVRFVRTLLTLLQEFPLSSSVLKPLLPVPS